MDQGGDATLRGRAPRLGGGRLEVGQFVHLQVEAAGLQADATSGGRALQSDQAFGSFDRGVHQLHRRAEHLHRPALQGTALQMDLAGLLVGGGHGLKGDQAPLPRDARVQLEVVEIEALPPQAHLLIGLEGAAGTSHRLHRRFRSLNQKGALHLNPASLEHHRAGRGQPQVVQGGLRHRGRLAEIGNAVQAAGFLSRGAEHIKTLAVAQMDAGGRAQQQRFHW